MLRFLILIVIFYLNLGLLRGIYPYELMLAPSLRFLLSHVQTLRLFAYALIMRPEQWEIFKRAARLEKLDKIPMALIIDSPWIPGYLGIKHMDYFLDPELWFQSQPEDPPGIPRHHFRPVLVDGIWHGRRTFGARLQNQILAGQHAQRIPHALSYRGHR